MKENMVAIAKEYYPGFNWSSFDVDTPGVICIKGVPNEHTISNVFVDGFEIQVWQSAETGSAKAYASFLMLKSPVTMETRLFKLPSYALFDLWARLTVIADTFRSIAGNIDGNH